MIKISKEKAILLHQIMAEATGGDVLLSGDYSTDGDYSMKLVGAVVARSVPPLCRSIRHALKGPERCTGIAERRMDGTE